MKDASWLSSFDVRDLGGHDSAGSSWDVEKQNLKIATSQVISVVALSMGFQRMF